MLTPEERQKIYLEEKARLEVRTELQQQKKGLGIGSFLGLSALGVIAFILFLLMIGSSMDSDSSAKFRALTPTQQHAKTLETCAKLRRSWAFKTYSELTQEQRQALYSCGVYERQ